MRNTTKSVDEWPVARQQRHLVGVCVITIVKKVDATKV